MKIMFRVKLLERWCWRKCSVNPNQAIGIAGETPALNVVIADRVSRSEFLWAAGEDLGNDVQDRRIPTSEREGVGEEGRDGNSRVPSQPRGSTCILTKLT